jgi:hypothetical protein
MPSPRSMQPPDKPLPPLPVAKSPSPRNAQPLPVPRPPSPPRVADTPTSPSPISPASNPDSRPPFVRTLRAIPSDFAVDVAMEAPAAKAISAESVLKPAAEALPSDAPALRRRTLSFSSEPPAVVKIPSNPPDAAPPSLPVVYGFLLSSLRLRRDFMDFIGRRAECRTIGWSIRSHGIVAKCCSSFTVALRSSRRNTPPSSWYSFFFFF